MFSIRQRALAEVFGTAALVLVGPGSVIATLALAGKAVPAVTEADLLGISFAFGFIITALVYAIGKVSGCHINPAVTFALAATKRFPWREVPLYWGGQVFGGVLGALAIWASFGDRATHLGYGFGVVNFNHATTAWGSAMFIEALGTGILMFTVLGIVDSRSPEGWAGLVIGLVVVAIIITVGPVTNASINPARQLGPLFLQTVDGAHTHNWIKAFGAYIPANLIGATLAAFAYDLIATPRKVFRPIKEAVTEPDRAQVEEGVLA